MSLGKDLASIRKELGLSLEEIKSSIKIPVPILKSIENDSIFDSTEHNNTYIRSFVRSYARALKLNDEDIVKALDDIDAGIYQDDLIAKDEERKTSQSIPKKEETPFSLDDVTPPEIGKAKSKPKADVDSVNWADFGQSFSMKESGSKNWIFLLIVFFIAALTVIGFFFRTEISGFFNSSEPQIVEPVENTFPTPIPETEPPIEDSILVLDITPPVQEEVPDPVNITNRVLTQSLSSLDSVLTVGVYAAFDRLEPVRVTSDINGRTNPFWMEQGEAFQFEFNDSLLVRGQYSRMLLLFNGHVIENPSQYFDPEFNAVLLTRSILNNDTYLSPAPPEFPYDVGSPDSLVYPIRY